MSSPDSEKSPQSRDANRDVTSLTAGAVFVRKSAILPEALQQIEHSIVLGWRWLFLNETEFHSALKDAGWKWYFLGEPQTVKAFGSLTSASVNRLLEKALLTIHHHNPNTFTVTDISAKSLLGVKSVSLSFQARHVQRAIPSKAAPKPS